MKRFLLTAVPAAILGILASGCAKEREVPENADAKLYFDSWMHVHHAGVPASGNGIYIIDDIPPQNAETATPLGDSLFAYVSYVATDLEGNVTDYSEESTARQLGQYSSTSYYGPVIWTRSNGFLYAGVNDLLTGMSEGGTRTAIIPGWLMSNTWYSNEQEFLDNVSGTNSIYTVTLKKAIGDITEWQIDSIGRFLSGGYKEHDFGYLNSSLDQSMEGMSARDSSDMYGFYFIELEHGEELEPVEDSSSDEDEDTDEGYDWEDSHFYTTTGSTDTTIYINYVGRLLNGTVFDTNILRVAQDNGLSGGTYEPVAIQWGDSYSSLVMGTDSSTPNMITGFAMTLWKMHPFGKAIGIFYSNFGYGYSGSGNTIPGYSPLMFEIEVVEEPEE